MTFQTEQDSVQFAMTIGTSLAGMVGELLFAALLVAAVFTVHHSVKKQPRRRVPLSDNNDLKTEEAMQRGFGEPVACVHTLMHLPRRDYLCSFDRFLLLVKLLLKNWRKIENQTDPSTTIATWLLERNPSSDEYNRVLRAIHDFDQEDSSPRSILIDVVLKLKDNFSIRDPKRKSKKVSPVGIMLLEALCVVKSSAHFDQLRDLLLVVELRSEVAIQKFVEACIACNRLAIMEDLLLTLQWCTVKEATVERIRQLIGDAYIQKNLLYAADHFLARARHAGLPSELVQSLENRVQLEKKEVEKNQAWAQMDTRKNSVKSFDKPPNSRKEPRSTVFVPSFDDGLSTNSQSDWPKKFNNTRNTLPATILPANIPTPLSKLRREESSKASNGRTVRWYTTAICDCGKRGEWRRALAFFDEIAENGLQPDTIAYSASINACAKACQWGHALKLFEEMKRRSLSLNERVYGAVLHACAKAKHWERALGLLDEMREAGLRPNVYNYCAAISACETANQYDSSLDLFEQLKADGIKPNLIVYSVVISACWKSMKYDMAFELFSEMKARGFTPNQITYKLIFMGALASGDSARMEAVKKEMQREGIFEEQSMLPSRKMSEWSLSETSTNFAEGNTTPSSSESSTSHICSRLGCPPGLCLEKMVKYQ